MTADHRPPTVIGFLGGSFDPIHNGHIALAQAALEQLQLDALHLIPAGQPWQRAPLQATPAHRLAMTQLAFANQAQITVDPRELTRTGSTYTYDTLQALRQELGAQAVLVWIIGSDQLHNLPSWHRVQDLFLLAHFAVAQRAGDPPLSVPSALKNVLNLPTHTTYDQDGQDDHTWRQHPAGSLIQFTMPPVNLSATQLRGALKQGQSAAGLVPTSVLHYIEQHSLYR